MRGLVVPSFFGVWLVACGGGELSAKSEPDGGSGPQAGDGDVVPTPDARARKDGGAVPESDARPHPDAAGKSDAIDSDAAAQDAVTPPPTDAASPPPPAPDAAVPPPGLVCDPPNTQLVGNHCVPSCGGAGGNRCVGAGDPVCAGWPTLESYDCALCCAVVEGPPIRPNSHHTVVIADVDTWDAILDLSNRDLGPMITSQNKPDQLPFERWAKNVSAYDAQGNPRDPNELAAAVNGLFADPAGAPAKILIDELASGSAATVEGFANVMAGTYPQWRGRWGVHLAPGENVDYAAWQAPIDAALSAGAILLPEMYFYRSTYCSHGNNGGQRDIWLASMFTGDASVRRVGFLLDERARLGSTSQISPSFGVIDARCHDVNGVRTCDLEGYLSGPQPAVFLDRMFYVWVTRTRPDMVDLVRPENGGIGAWKWDASQVNNTSRDLAFAQSFDHYLIQGLRDSMRGPVDCP